MAPKRKVMSRPHSGGRKKCTETDDGVEKSSEKAPPSLLTIPGELRNYIYELVLIASEAKITVTNELKQPGLLAVNRQVRSECKEIWLEENVFHFEYFDCDTKLVIPFVSFVRSIEAGSDFHVHTNHTFYGNGTNWGNLINWCWLLQVRGAEISFHDDDEYMVVIAAATRIAVAHAESSWEMCMHNLDSLRMVAGRLDPGWLVD